MDVVEPGGSPDWRRYAADDELLEREHEVRCQPDVQQQVVQVVLLRVVLGVVEVHLRKRHDEAGLRCVVRRALRQRPHPQLFRDLPRQPPDVSRSLGVVPDALVLTVRRVLQNRLDSLDEDLGQELCAEPQVPPPNHRGVLNDVHLPASPNPRVLADGLEPFPELLD